MCGIILMFIKFNNFLKNLFSSTEDVKLIVLGHQKSGTTAIAALLARISDSTMSNDPLFMIDQGAGEVVDKLISSGHHLKTLCGMYPDLFTKKIIKDPDFIFIFPSLKKVYIDARFLFVVRDPRDTIRSICNRLRVPGTEKIKKLKYNDMYMGNHHWELILSGELPAQKNTGNKHTNYIQNLANRWNMAVEIYLNNIDDMILIKYEDFSQNKEKIITKLAVDAGLQCKKSIAEYVDIQYQPKGNANADWGEFFGRDNLASIENICGLHMQRFRY